MERFSKIFVGTLQYIWLDIYCIGPGSYKYDSFIMFIGNNIYCKTSNTRQNLVGNKIVDHSDVVGALPVGAAPTTSSFST